MPPSRPLSPHHWEQRRPRSGRGSGAGVDCGHRIPPLPSYHGGPKGVAADGSNLKQPLRARCWQPPACGSISYSCLWTPSLLGSEPSWCRPHTRLGAHGGMCPAAGGAAPGGAARLSVFKELKWFACRSFSWTTLFCKSNRKVRLLGQQLTGMEKNLFYFPQIRNTCLLAVEMDLCINSLKPKHCHKCGRKRTTMTTNICHTFSMQKTQIMKCVAEYRYIAKEMWFHNIPPLQTILPLHNFTNFMKIFLLKANMIYTNQSEAAEIWRKHDAFTVWKTRHYIYGHKQKPRQWLLGKDIQKF